MLLSHVESSPALRPPPHPPRHRAPPPLPRPLRPCLRLAPLARQRRQALHQLQRQVRLRAPRQRVHPLPVGRNMVEVVFPGHLYPLLMVDVKSSGENVYQLVHPVFKTVLERAGEPLYLKPIERLQYLFEEPGFSIASFLFSGTGMFLMFGVLMYLCYNTLMPKLEEAQLAPESSAQVNRQ